MIFIGCFSVLKARIKNFLAMRRDPMSDHRTFATLTESDMAPLGQVAAHALPSIDIRPVNKMALHCQHSVAAAI